jgi:hypothetical protein
MILRLCSFARLILFLLKGACLSVATDRQATDKADLREFSLQICVKTPSISD